MFGSQQSFKYRLVFNIGRLAICFCLGQCNVTQELSFFITSDSYQLVIRAKIIGKVPRTHPGLTAYKIKTIQVRMYLMHHFQIPNFPMQSFFLTRNCLVCFLFYPDV